MRQRVRAGSLMVDLVAGACRLVNSDDGVRGVHIVAQRRPTYREMVRLRHAARESHAGMTVNGQGVITIRPGAR